MTGSGGGWTPAGTQHYHCVSRKRRGWDNKKVSSSVLLFVFVQHLLLLILVFFLNKREIEDDKAAMMTMRDGDGWEEEQISSSLLVILHIRRLLLLKGGLHLQLFDGSSESLHFLSGAPPQLQQHQGSGTSSPLATREASIEIVSVVGVKYGRNLV